LARALVPDHQKAFSIGRNVVRGMTGAVGLVWPVEKDFRSSDPERRLGRNRRRDQRRSLAVKELAPVARPDGLFPSLRRDQDPHPRTRERLRGDSNLVVNN